MSDANIVIGSLKNVRQSAELLPVTKPWRCKRVSDFRASLSEEDIFRHHCQTYPVMLVREGAVPDVWGPAILIDWRTCEVVQVTPVYPESLGALNDMLNKQLLSLVVGPRARLLLFLTDNQPHKYKPDADLVRLSQTSFGQAIQHALEKTEAMA